ncbi:MULTISPECIES: aminoacyl-tRNA hydrolase [unclassified Corynebacterium]|uniref:aminoacyl-tRNA hydrolase n=1 Tax=unclassified Corynebacterium TaxID=2624378 RepID=UPI0029C9D3DA|nr:MULTISPECIES: aminoacyl-tRNA hydrolase [unclassified Corynebacterium]WPF67248.1 aminoacyl-tRNA hydrolase [Corynebacterium sp. 22KM0430]WPF69737.1 aminoacyl-tRNA hydrolase [Corynebacterium sp. 21KM1197]
MDIFRSPRSPQEADLHGVQWLIIGLGNPGPRYQNTPHNVGYLALDALRGSTPLLPCAGVPVTACRSTIDAVPVALLRSTTYMNESGQAVAPLASALGIPPERIVVLHDELDLPTGTTRLRQGGAENGHNGLKSISAELGTRDYLRVRMGISRPPKGTPVVDYVLGEMADTPELRSGVEHAADAARLIVSQGLARAQNEIHRR